MGLKAMNWLMGADGAVIFLTRYRARTFHEGLVVRENITIAGKYANGLQCINHL